LRGIHEDAQWLGHEITSNKAMQRRQPEKKHRPLPVAEHGEQKRDPSGARRRRFGAASPTISSIIVCSLFLLLPSPSTETFREHDVGGLGIAMDDSLPVCLIQIVCKIDGVFQNFLSGQ
jgi:hypothetical protein